MATKKNKQNVVLQYGSKSVSYDELVVRMKEKWTRDYGKKVSELKSIELYVKPEEDKVYYVINDGEETGDFAL